MSLFDELKRRNVFRVAVAYLVASWVLLQIVDVVTPIMALPDWIPRAILLLLGIGFPLAVILAWAFELTPEGVKREHEVDRSQSITPHTGKKLNGLIIGGLAFVILLMGLERVFLAGQDESPAGEIDRSVAVLPFDDMSESGDQEWFADGLAEEILNSLTRTPDLKVASRTASFAFKNTQTPLPQIAEDLGVAHILEGSVRRSGDRLRVTAQLIRADDGFHVFSENYDRTVDDVIAIQEDLAVNIALALETTMDGDALEQMAGAGTASVSAYLDYLQALSISAQAASEGDSSLLLESLNHAEAAVREDPEFWMAHLWLARFWRDQQSSVLVNSGLTNLSNAETRARFSESIGRAIETAPSLADRLGAEALWAGSELRWRDAIAKYREYLTHRPHDRYAVLNLYLIAASAEDTDAAGLAMALQKEAGKTDAESARDFVNLAYRLGRADEGADYGLEALKRWPNHVALMYQTHRSLLWAGRQDEAARLARRYFEVSTERNRPILEVRDACSRGDRPTAEAILAEVESANREFSDQSVRWHILMLLGQQEQATNVLREIAADRDVSAITGYLWYRAFDPSPFPELVRVLERERVIRPPVAPIPFACPPPEAEDKSVAVLPFVNMSGSEEQEYFSDGITEEVINALVRIPDMNVAARTSVFAFKGTNKDIREIGQELDVSHVVEGSVRSDGQQIRITAQLIKVDDGFHVWSDTYDRELVNVFAIQEDIANHIADVLVEEFSEEAESAEVAHTTVDAYDNYLRGRALLRVRGEANLREATRLFQLAVDSDPEFAPAWAAMAIAAQVLYENELAQEYANRALALDPENVEALDALASAYRENWRFMEARELYHLALAIDPEASELVEDYAEFLLTTGDIEGLLPVITRGYELDPYLTPMGWVYSQALLASGNPEEAMVVVDRALERTNVMWLWAARLMALAQMGDEAAMIDQLNRMSLPEIIRDASVRLVSDPEDTEARDTLRQLLDPEHYTTDGAAGLGETVLLHAGDTEFVLQKITENFAGSMSGEMETMWMPHYAKMRRLPGFADLVEVVGLDQYWDEVGWPELCQRQDSGEIRCH